MQRFSINKQKGKLQHKFIYLFLLFLWLNLDYHVFCIQLNQKKVDQQKNIDSSSLKVKRQSKFIVNSESQQQIEKEIDKLNNSQKRVNQIKTEPLFVKNTRLLFPETISSQQNNNSDWNPQPNRQTRPINELSRDLTLTQLKNSGLQKALGEEIKNSLSSFSENIDSTQNIKNFLSNTNQRQLSSLTVSEKSVKKNILPAEKQIFMSSGKTSVQSSTSSSFAGSSTSNVLYNNGYYSNSFSSNQQSHSAYQFSHQGSLRSYGQYFSDQMYAAPPQYSNAQPFFNPRPQYYRPGQMSFGQFNSPQYSTYTPQMRGVDSSISFVPYNQNWNNQQTPSTINLDYSTTPSNNNQQPYQNPTYPTHQPSILPPPPQLPLPFSQKSDQNFNNLIREIIRPTQQPQQQSPSSNSDQTKDFTKDINYYLASGLGTKITTKKNQDGTTTTSIVPNITKDYIKSQITNNLVNQMFRLVDSNANNGNLVQRNKDQNIIRFKNLSFSSQGNVPNQLLYTNTGNQIRESELQAPRGGNNIALSILEPPYMSDQTSNGNTNKTYLRIQDYLIRYGQHEFDISKDDIKSFRQGVLNVNIDIVNSHNSLTNKTFDMGLGPFGSYQLDQFNKKFAKLTIPDDLKSEANSQGAQNFNTKLPQIVIDWRCKASQIISQGVCGACYVISALQSILITNRINKQEASFLSIQEVISCSKRTLALNGCSGGFFTGTFQYVRINGVGQNSFYYYDDNAKYQGIESPCNSRLTQTPQYDVKRIRIRGYDRIQPGNCLALINMLKVRSVAVAIAAYKFQFYLSGTFTTDSRDTNHGVTLVGYYPEQGFLIKNSWGVTWGNLGYGFVDKSTRVCDFAVAPATIFENNPGPPCSKRQIVSLGIQPQPNSSK